MLPGRRSPGNWPGVDSGKRDESGRAQVGCVGGGRLQNRGKSKRTEAPAAGHRSDSSGIVDQFPTQRSSDSGLVALRLSHPEGLPGVKIFSHPGRCPRHTHRLFPGMVSGSRVHLEWWLAVEDMWLYGGKMYCVSGRKHGTCQKTGDGI